MQYFFMVHGRRDINAYDSNEEIHATFERIGRFNRKLQDEDHWVMSGGLVPPKGTMAVLPDGSHSDLPYYNAMMFPSAFWIVQVADEQEVTNLAHEAVKARVQIVEARATTEQHAD